MKKCYQKNKAKGKGNNGKNSKQKKPVQLPLTREDLLNMLQDELHSFAVNAGIIIASELLADEVSRLCGDRYKRNPAKENSRYGSQRGVVTISGQKHPIEKPRVRKKSGGETALKTYALLQRDGAMPEAALRRMVRGVSCRDYEEVIDIGVQGFGVKRSSVSRAFVKGSAKSLKKLSERNFKGTRFVVIFIDGVEYGGVTMAVALGITQEGRKRILGLRQGGTENSEVVTSLLEDIVDKGVDASLPTLFALDGAKALKSAVKRVWGKKAVIQRCQAHKKRNVKRHLPENLWDDISRRLSEAYNETNYDKALKKLKNTERWLERINPSAAASLREGMEETLTVVRLGIPDTLRKSVASTNVVESAFSVTRNVTGRVKRWRDGDMRLRWCAAGLLRAEEKFKRVKGYRDIPQLIKRLERVVSEQLFDTNEKVA